jgi:hypothetical protein
MEKYDQYRNGFCCINVSFIWLTNFDAQQARISEKSVIMGAGLTCM